MVGHKIYAMMKHAATNTNNLRQIQVCIALIIKRRLLAQLPPRPQYLVLLARDDRRLSDPDDCLVRFNDPVPFFVFPLWPFYRSFVFIILRPFCFADGKPLDNGILEWESWASFT